MYTIPVNHYQFSTHMSCPWCSAHSYHTFIVTEDTDRTADGECEKCGQGLTWFIKWDLTKKPHRFGVAVAKVDPVAGS